MVLFSDDGGLLFSCTSDGSVCTYDPQSGKSVATLGAAHAASINAGAYVAGAGLLATGDDEGVVKLWDVRQKGCAATYRGHGDFISDLKPVAPAAAAPGALWLMRGGAGWRRSGARCSPRRATAPSR